jgi:hypothetical protein
LQIGDYRRIATATGPAATKGSYTATLDPGKELPSSVAGTTPNFSHVRFKSCLIKEFDTLLYFILIISCSSPPFR